MKNRSEEVSTQSHTKKKYSGHPTCNKFLKRYNAAGIGKTLTSSYVVLNLVQRRDLGISKEKNQ